MKALSLFNGISALHLALDRAEIKVSQVYYAEIDKYANKITEQHYPDDVALGDVTKWREWDVDWADIGLVGAGFPCQAWSVAGKQLGDKDERGMLFWTTLEIIAHVLKHNPKAKFLMENVKMKKEFEEYITHHTEQALGHVEKTLINSALVSAQNRQRYYWTNFEVTQPDDKGILLKDILDISTNGFISLGESNYTERCKKQIKKNSKTEDQKAVALCTNSNLTGSGVNVLAIHGGAIRGRYLVDGKRQDHKVKTAGLTEQRLEVRKDEKTNTLTTVQKDNVVVCNVNPSGRGMNGNVYNDSRPKSPCLTTNKGEGLKIGSSDGDMVYYRKLTPLECERLQTFPCGWTDSVSNTQRYKALGNAWTVDVIVHILKCAFK